MKRLILILLLITLALTVVPVAAAAGNGKAKARGKAKFSLVGTLTAVDVAAGVVTLKIRAGTRTVKKYRGEELSMTAAPGARIRLVTVDGSARATLADLAAVPRGAKLKARGRIDRSDPSAPSFVITFLQVRVPAPAPEPDPPPVE